MDALIGLARNLTLVQTGVWYSTPVICVKDREEWERTRSFQSHGQQCGSEMLAGYGVRVDEICLFLSNYPSVDEDTDKVVWLFALLKMFYSAHFCRIWKPFTDDVGKWIEEFHQDFDESLDRFATSVLEEHWQSIKKLLKLTVSFQVVPPRSFVESRGRRTYLGYVPERRAVR